MDDGTVLEVRINGEINGDAACLAKLQNTAESISSPSTPGVETSSSLSDTTITLIRKELEQENFSAKPKINDQSHAENFIKSNEQASDSRDSSDSRRKFRVLGLTFPGKWMTSEKFWDLLEKSESFHIWFDKTTKGGIKHGGLSAVYETPEEAKLAFAAFHKMTFDGNPLKLQASKLFYDPVPNSRIVQPPMPFKINMSDPDASRRLYALHLSTATDQTLLSSIFGSECIETIQLEADPFIASEKQAEIVFHTVQEANDARVELADGFEIDEGDRQLTMRLLTMDEYISYMKTENDKILNARVVPVSGSSAPSSSSSQPSPSVSSTAIAATSETAVVPFIPAPEVTVEDVTSFVQQYVDDTRTNWAELNELNELWKLCDEVSQLHRGIPDSLLKIALLNVLERHQRSLPTHWMRQHVDNLIRIWKKEVQNTRGVQRSTSYIMSAAPYIPYDIPERKNSENSTRKRALATIMGVGEVLAKVRTMLATEEGELDVDEDEHGNYTIDGQPLSFESWASINKPVKPAPVYERPQLYIDPKMRKLRNQWKKETWQRKLEEEKVKKTQEVVPEIENENEKDEMAPDGEVVRAETETPVIRRELEEGEMSSESSSSSSASTSSDEDIDDGPTSRHRRRKRRRHEKSSQLNSVQAAMGSVNPQFTTLFAQLYEHRHTLCRLLLSSHKNGFASVLGQILSSPQGMTSAQQNQMNLFIQNFSAQNLPK
ncbi:spliced leader protein [Loa loa]|nr:spliced leader protein [Loa loa]EFO23588.1 spliced leader protein [Loa loa]